MRIGTGGEGSKRNEQGGNGAGGRVGGGEDYEKADHKKTRGPRRGHAVNRANGARTLRRIGQGRCEHGRASLSGSTTLFNGRDNGSVYHWSGRRRRWRQRMRGRGHRGGRRRSGRRARAHTEDAYPVARSTRYQLISIERLI